MGITKKDSFFVGLIDKDTFKKFAKNDVLNLIKHCSFCGYYDLYED